MTSLTMRLVAAYLRRTAKPSMSTVERAQQVIAGPKVCTPPPAAVSKRHAIATQRINGFVNYTVAPRDRPAQYAAMYLHGGAYIGGLSPEHWTLISRLADAGVRVEVPDYGLAPQHTYRDAYPFVTAVYRELLKEFGAAMVGIAGDSAGAGLALGFAQSLADAGLPQPRRLTLIAPWLDVSLGNPELPAAEARDPWLSSVGLREAGRAWAGGDDPSLPALSPINGSLAGLAPIDVYVGTRDLFHPDALSLKQRAAAEGAELHLTSCEGAVHVYPLTPTPEGRAARRLIIASMSR
jgi:epsilon-lactone hydrolase